MTSERGQRVRELFEAAVERPAAARESFVATAAGADEELRAQVAALLASDTANVTAFDRFPLAGHAVLANAPSPSSVSDEIRAQPTLARGHRVGPYEVATLLGAGGMGQVYRARDTKLHRDVALKVLPEQFAVDVDRVARFRREAQMLAALNHPHIAAIYGFEEESRGEPALVMELVDGPTLADLIAQGPLPLRQALNLAGQIAEALEAAHDRGIIHRDLKPANIKVAKNGSVKVLDFGLAKAWDDAPDAPRSGVPTVTATNERTIVGTPAYMSPEQAKGWPVDQRADVWAFGAVLCEMLSGRQTFGADSVSDTLAHVMSNEPDWSALPAATPSPIRRLVRHCLEKDPGTRLHDIAAARIEIDRVLVRLAHPNRQIAVLSAVAGAMALAIAIGAILWFQPDRRAGTDHSEWVQLTRFPDFATQPALSPDGRTLAFIRGADSRLVSEGQIYIKSLPDGTPVQLTHDNLRKMSPVFSPDGHRIAYTVGATWDTWVVPVPGGDPYVWLRNASGLTWVGPREVLFSETKAGRGGYMGIVTSADSRIDSRVLYWPSVQGMAHRSYRSPDGRSVLIAEMDGPGTFLPCRQLPFDGSSIGRTVGPAKARCTFAGWSPDGRWMYFSADAGDGSHLWRQRFPDEPVEQITSGPTEEEGLVVSADGRSLITSVGLRQRAVWVHHAGGERQLSVEGYASAPLVSADGHNVYYLVANRFSDDGLRKTPGELRVTNVESGRTERLLAGQTVTGFDLSRDGRIAAAVVESDGGTQVWLTSPDGSTAPRRVPMAKGDEPRFSPTGEIIFRASAGTMRIHQDGSGRQQLNVGSRNLGTTSPDGQWISAEKGVGTAPPTWLFSLSGADPILIYPEHMRVRWASDGLRLYLSTDRRTYVLPVPKGSILPPIPSGGFRTEAEIAALPAVEIIPHGDVGPGPAQNIYAFARDTVSRNIYQIPLQ